MKTTRRKQAVKLKVVGGATRPPRHRVVFGSWPDSRIIEFWTEAEFRVLEEWERPEDRRAAWIPGIGYMTFKITESAEEHNEVAREYGEAFEQGLLQREYRL